MEFPPFQPDNQEDTYINAIAGITNEGADCKYNEEGKYECEILDEVHPPKGGHKQLYIALRSITCHIPRKTKLRLGKYKDVSPIVHVSLEEIKTEFNPNGIVSTHRLNTEASDIEFEDNLHVYNAKKLQYFPITKPFTKILTLQLYSFDENGREAYLITNAAKNQGYQCILHFCIRSMDIVSKIIYVSSSKDATSKGNAAKFSRVLPPNFAETGTGNYNWSMNISSIILPTLLAPLPKEIEDDLSFSRLWFSFKGTVPDTSITTIVNEGEGIDDPEEIPWLKIGEQGHIYYGIKIGIDEINASKDVDEMHDILLELLAKIPNTNIIEEVDANNETTTNGKIFFCLKDDSKGTEMKIILHETIGTFFSLSEYHRQVSGVAPRYVENEYAKPLRDYGFKCTFSIKKAPLERDKGKWNARIEGHSLFPPFLYLTCNIARGLNSSATSVFGNAAIIATIPATNTTIYRPDDIDTHRIYEPLIPLHIALMPTFSKTIEFSLHTPDGEPARFRTHTGTREEQLHTTINCIFSLQTQF